MTNAREIAEARFARGEITAAQLAEIVAVLDKAPQQKSEGGGLYGWNSVLVGIGLIGLNFILMLMPFSNFLPFLKWLYVVGIFGGFVVVLFGFSEVANLIAGKRT